MRRRIPARKFLLMLSGLVFLSPMAIAAEIPVFKDMPEPSARLLISAYLGKDNKTLERFSFARIDLNGDSVPEYLLKDRECTNLRGFCDYMILAERRGEMLPLLMIKAKDMKISDTKTNGIHDILAIQGEKNDYEYLRYIWSSADMTFMPAESEK